MGFHFSEATCYLTADLFYLEVALSLQGGVQDVKVAPHGQPPMVRTICHDQTNVLIWLIGLSP